MGMWKLFLKIEKKEKCKCRPPQRQEVFLSLRLLFYSLSLAFIFSLSSSEPENELGVAAKTGRPQDEMGGFFFTAGWDGKARETCQGKQKEGQAGREKGEERALVKVRGARRSFSGKLRYGHIGCLCFQISFISFRSLLLFLLCHCWS